MTQLYRTQRTTALNPAPQQVSYNKSTHLSPHHKNSLYDANAHSRSERRTVSPTHSPQTHAALKHRISIASLAARPRLSFHHQPASNPPPPTPRINIQRHHVTHPSLSRSLHIHNHKPHQRTALFRHNHACILCLGEPPHGSARKSKRPLKTRHIERIHRVGILGAVSPKLHRIASNGTVVTLKSRQ